MVPEWTLAIFMEKYDMDRKSAIEKIQQQSYWQDNQVDDSEILATTQNSFDEDAWRALFRATVQKQKNVIHQSG